MAEGPRNALFLWSGNSARSIMAECAMNRWGKGRFKAFSAGSRPKGAVHPLALELLGQLDYDTRDLRSKSWDEFTTSAAPRFDFIFFTVCDNAGAEQCPLWPGRPVTAHWGVEDPAAFAGTLDEQRRCFERVYRELENRIRGFIERVLDASERKETSN
jgi:protein-tyrosine-phosphatase